MGQALGREVPVADLDALHVAIAEGHCVTVHQVCVFVVWEAGMS